MTVISSVPSAICPTANQVRQIRFRSTVDTLQSNGRPPLNELSDPDRHQAPQGSEVTLSRSAMRATTEGLATVAKMVTPADKCENDDIYGVKKQFLYVMIAMSWITVVMNLSLNIWIIKVLDLTSVGIGSMSLSSSGVKIKSPVESLDKIKARYVTAPKNQNLRLESGGNVTVVSYNPQPGRSSYVNLGKDGFETVGKRFIVSNSEGQVLFRVDPSEVLVAADDVNIANSGGLRLDGSLETSLIRGELSKDLRIESPRKSVKIEGDNEVLVESRAGKIEIRALNDVDIQGKKRIILDNSKLRMRNLPISKVYGRAGAAKSFQVCSCENGRLFLAPAEDTCQIEMAICSQSDSASGSSSGGTTQREKPVEFPILKSY